MKVLVFISLVSCLFAGQVLAQCACLCVNGHVEAVCSKSIDVRPVCAPRFCPTVAPSVPPVTAPSVPPIGTTKCFSQMIYNEETNQYEWRQVCY